MPSVPNTLSEINDYAQLMDVAEEAARYRSGAAVGLRRLRHTTFFIKSEAEFRKHQHDIIGQGEIKVMKRINCGAARH